MDESIKEYGFMNEKGDLETVKFTLEQRNRGELRAHIEYMKEEGYTYMGVLVN